MVWGSLRYAILRKTPAVIFVDCGMRTNTLLNQNSYRSGCIAQISAHYVGEYGSVCAILGE